MPTRCSAGGRMRCAGFEAGRERESIRARKASLRPSPSSLAWSREGYRPSARAFLLIASEQPPASGRTDVPSRSFASPASLPPPRHGMLSLNFTDILLLVISVHCTVLRGVRSVVMFCYVFFLTFRLPIGLHSSCCMSPTASGSFQKCLTKYHG